jgi:hypothetical protein
MGMDLAVAGIDHQPLIIRLVNEYLQQGLPLPFVAPAAKPPMGVLPVSVVWWQISPGGAGTQYPEYRVDELPIIAGVASPGTFAPQQARLQ